MSLLATLLRRKSIEQISAHAEDAEGPKLKKVLNARDVFNHGVAAIIGTGIFVLTGVAAHDYAGPGILLSFVLAGLACAFVSFAYAELASMIPISGSAYTYAYATLGEIIAWIIGWDLLLEYAVGASAVAVGWSAYLQNIMRSLGIHLPDVLSHAPASMPWSQVLGAIGLVALGIVACRKGVNARNAAASSAQHYLLLAVGAVMTVFGLVNGWNVVTHLTSVDLPAVLIIAFLNFWLVKGVNHTAKMTAVFVVVKLAVIALFIAVGVWHVQPTNFVPFLPFGFHGVLAGAAIVFFAYIGFDAVTTLAEECKNPQTDVPKGVIWSLVVCTILYLLVAGIMVGAMSYTMLGGTEAAAPMARVLNYLGYWWASPLVSLGAVAGITSVLIVLLFGQSRIMMRMSKDGLISPIFGRIHQRFQTPVWSILICGAVVAMFSGLLPISELAELSNIGTLAALVLVCLGVLILRKSDPNRQRKFRCPDYARAPMIISVLHFVGIGVTAFFFPGFLMSVGLPVPAIDVFGLFTIPAFGITWLAMFLTMGIVFAVLHFVQKIWGHPWMPIMGALMSAALALGLPGVTWIRFVIWMGVGFVIYFAYGRKHSLMNGTDTKNQKTLR